MGQAKKRGTLEQRKQAAIENAPKPLSDKDREEIKNHLDKLTKIEEDSSRVLITRYHKRTRFYERIMHSAATPAELLGA